MKWCSNCGCQLADDAKFCVSCGTAQQAIPRQNAQSQTFVPPQPHVPQPQIPVPNVPQPHVPQPHVPQPQIPVPPVPQPNYVLDLPSGGLNFLAFLFPFIGFIMFLAMKRSRPVRATSIGKWALISVFLGLVLAILAVVGVAVVASLAGGYYW